MKRATPLRPALPVRGTPVRRKAFPADTLSAPQLAEVLEEQRRRLQSRSHHETLRLEDVLFGQLVVKEKLVSRQEVNAALRIPESWPRRATAARASSASPRGFFG